MRDILSVLCFVLALVVIGCLDRYTRGSRLFDHVSWCMTKSNDSWEVILEGLTTSGDPFYEIIPDKYRIQSRNGDDLDYKRIIGAAYKRDLADLYFNKRLRADRNVLSLSDEQFFMFTLYGFLIEHCGDRELAGKEMFHCDRWETRGSEANGYSVRVCSLTDFAVLYYKMLYATNVFCRHSKGKAFSSVISRKDMIAKCLDTRRAEFY